MSTLLNTEQVLNLSNRMTNKCIHDRHMIVTITVARIIKFELMVKTGILMVCCTERMIKCDKSGKSAYT